MFGGRTVSGLLNSSLTTGGFYGYKGFFFWNPFAYFSQMSNENVGWSCNEYSSYFVSTLEV